jgi:hypothetical protein
VIGTTGLEQALRERGLVPVDSADDDPAAVVQGYSPDLDWRQLAEGAVAIRRGLPWVATNADPTVPSARGPLPGNGSLVAALRHATGAEPVVTGKPAPAMHLESVQRSGARSPIVVGDRLDTDVQGANAVGCASLLVLTGVTAPADLLGAGPLLRPTYIAPDVGGLLAAHDAPTLEDASARCGGWTATSVAGDCAELDSDPGNGVAEGTRGSADQLDPLRALCALAWGTGGGDESGDGPFAEIRAGDEAAANALRALGLGG